MSAIQKIKITIYCVLHPWKHDCYIDPKGKLIKKIFLYAVVYSAYTLLWVPPFTPIPTVSLFVDLCKFCWKKHQVKQLKNDTEITHKTDKNYQNKIELPKEEKKENIIHALRKEATESNNRLLTAASKKLSEGEIHPKMENDIKDFWTRQGNQLINLKEESALNLIKNNTIESVISDIEQRREVLAQKLKKKRNERMKEIKEIRFENQLVEELVIRRLKKCSQVDLDNVKRIEPISFLDLVEMENCLEGIFFDIKIAVNKAQNEYDEIFKKYSTNEEMISLQYQDSLEPEIKAIMDELKKSVPELEENQLSLKIHYQLYLNAERKLKNSRIFEERKERGKIREEINRSKEEKIERIQSRSKNSCKLRIDHPLFLEAKEKLMDRSIDEITFGELSEIIYQNSLTDEGVKLLDHLTINDLIRNLNY